MRFAAFPPVVVGTVAACRVGLAGCQPSKSVRRRAIPEFTIEVTDDAVNVVAVPGGIVRTIKNNISIPMDIGLRLLKAARRKR